MNPDIQGSAYQFFIEEVPELLQIMETGILTLQTERSTATIHEIMRAAHSLKGGAASVELESIKEIAHRLEDYFKALYSDTVTIDAELETLLLQGYDCLRIPLLEQINTGKVEQVQALATAEPIFAQIEAKLGEALQNIDDFIPSSSDLGIDIASSIFEVDVENIIQNLDNLIANPENAQLAAELQGQIEVFSGFGELLNLPGVLAIAEAAQTALIANPEETNKILQQFREDVYQSRQAVLAGDRTSGGNPSPELLALSQADASPMPTPNPVNVDDPTYQFFIEEAEELLNVIETGILSLRESKATNKVHEIMRAAHSIKGGAASVGLEALKEIAHRLEDYFKALYDDSVIVDEELETLFLQGYDRLRLPLVEQIETNFHNPQQALIEAEPIFQAIEAQLGTALDHIDDYIPSSGDLGIDMVASIFEVDVQQELNRLQAVLDNPQDYEVAGEARALIDVFAGFGELLNLPGFTFTAQTALQALEKHPTQALDICQLMLRDFTQSREQVLGGDRTSGGQPSPELLALSAGENTSETELEASPLLEDVFNFDTENNIEVSTPPYLDDIFAESSTTETESLSLEDVFAQSDELEESTSTNELEESPALEDVFTESNELEESPALEDVFTESNELEESPALEDVFAQSDELEETASTNEIEESPALEDVFAESEADTSNAWLEEMFTQENKTSPEEIKTESANLEEIWGDIPDDISPDRQTEENVENPQLTAAEKVAKLNQTVQSIKNIYDELPVDNQVVTPPAAPESKSKPKPNIPVTKPTGKKSQATHGHLSVRIDLSRIERINNLIGELSINRNSLSLQNEQLQRTVRELLTRFSRFQEMNKKLREVLDQMLISPFSQYSQMPNYSYIASEFDSLEMDSYGAIHGILQELLEESIQLEESVEDISLFSRQSNQSIEQQRQMLTRVRDELMWARMLPLSEVLNRFPRVLRDLSTNYHKPVKLKLSGTGVLVDKAALEKLYDPLVHLLRNAFDHGIESPEIREKQGKPREGTIEIRAYHQGNQTIIQISDDGGGINLEKIGQKALEKQLLSPEQLAVASRDKLIDLIFEPGFSTAAQVSELSGRGVGLDVVRAQIRALKGSITLDTSIGKGTTFTLSLPLTLTIAKLLVCLVGSTAIALPSDGIEEIIIPQPEQVRVSGHQRFLQVGNQVIPAYRLQELLPYHCPVISNFNSKILLTVPTPEDWALPFLLIRRGQQVYALEVERLLTEQELVIKAFGVTMAPPSYVYGCTILGDGSLIPVMNASILLEVTLGEEQKTTQVNMLPQRNAPITPEAFTTAKTSAVLVVDDSAAMRRTLALTLEKAGYRVISAKDGREALEQLQRNAGIDLVICDIEMPNMNGFEFLTQRRRDQDYMKIPVAMLTSRSNDKHRRLAMQLGANAYFTKPYIEPEFLKSVKQILSQESPSLTGEKR